MKTLQDDRATSLKAHQVATEERMIQELFKEHPDLAMQANERILKSYFNGEAMTVETLREAVTLLGNLLGRKSHDEIEEAKQNEAEKAEELKQAERLRLLDEIARRLQRSGTPPLAVQAEIRSRYSYLNNEELQTKLDAMNEAKRLRGLSHEELRREARANLGQSTAPELPAEFTPEKIRGMAAPELRNLVERYGSTKVNERLGVQPTRKPGIGVRI